MARQAAGKKKKKILLFECLLQSPGDKKRHIYRVFPAHRKLVSVCWGMEKKYQSQKTRWAEGEGVKKVCPVCITRMQGMLFSLWFRDENWTRKTSVFLRMPNGQKNELK